MALVFCPHTTVGIIINENSDPDLYVVRDLIYSLEKVYPTNDNNYTHFEGNYHAHMKSSIVGVSQSLIICNGNLILGYW